MPSRAWHSQRFAINPLLDILENSVQHFQGKLEDQTPLRGFVAVNKYHKRVASTQVSFFLSWKCFSLIPPGRLRQTLEEAAHGCCDCGEGNNHVPMLLGLLHSASQEAFKGTGAQITSPVLITSPLPSQICGRERKTGKEKHHSCPSCTASKK